MRQGNGSELPGIGPNDPRSQSIGIIDVSPTDDRKSVLAAILTQEKLNRKQIAVILPTQNKAFQRPQDFDDLKSIRRKLQAELVFIVPNGPGPAEFAHQRRFPVYSTLDSFADSLRDAGNNPRPQPVRRSGGLFGGSRSKAAAAGAAGAVVGAAGAEAWQENLGPVPAAPIAQQSPVPAPVPPIAAVPSNLPPPPTATPRRSRALPPRPPVDEDVNETQPQRRGGGSTAAAAAAGAGAGFLAADLLHRGAAGGAAATPSVDSQDDWDLPPVQSGQGGQAPYPAPVPGNNPISPLPPTPPSPAQNDPDVTLVKGGESVPGIINLPNTKRNTTKLPVGGPAAGTESPATRNVSTQPPPTPPSTPPVRNAGARSNSGYIPVALAGAAVGAAAGTAMGAGEASQGNILPQGAAKNVRVIKRVGGGFPPLRGNAGAGGRGTGRQRRSRGAGFWLLLLLLLLLVFLVLGSLIWDSASPASFTNTVHHIIPNFSGSAASSPATVTITPDSQLVQDSYTLQAVSTTPDAALHQVALRTITFTTSNQTKSVTGTGKTVTVGLPAKGKIHFINGSSTNYTVAAGTLFHAGGGVDVTNNDSTTVPGGNVVNGSLVAGTKDDDATAVQPGANGDIAAGAVTLSPCCGSVFVSAISTDFTGGQDPQNYTFIKSSDVSSVVDPLKAQLLTDGQKGVHDQIKANEQTVNDISCNLAQSVDQHVGSDTGGKSITSANVTLAETCTVQVYDQSGPSGEQALVRTLLTQKASSTLGANYVLVGSIQINPGPSTLNANNLNMVVSSKGVWAYQFTDAQKQNLLKHIAGKTPADARTYLKSQSGVSTAKIDISNGGTSLPTDTTQITLTIQSISGASGGGATPAPTVTTNGPGAGSTPTVTGFGFIPNDDGNGKG